MPGVLMLAHSIAHGCCFTVMLAFPPQQVMQVAAKLFWRTFYNGDFQTICEAPAALGTDSGSNPFGFNVAMPRNAAIAVLIQTGSINRSNRLASASMPVLAVSPVVGHDCHAANFTVGKFAFIWRRISPHSAIAAIESARGAVIGPAVRHAGSIWHFVFSGCRKT